MREWLFNILKNNTLVDNQIYQTDDGILSNCRFNESIILERKGSGRHTKPWNDENKIWKFLNETNRDIQRLFLTEKNKAIILFNNRDYEHNSEDNFIDVNGMEVKQFWINGDHMKNN